MSTSTEKLGKNLADLSVSDQNSAHTQQKITPWDVEGAKVDGQIQAIDYDKLIDEFGSQPISDELLDRFKRLTGQTECHHFLRRGIFFSHRELGEILDLYEQKKPFYLYTGRGPSSASMHLGHMIPFMFTAYLQKTFKVPLVIQLTDDEKFLFKQGLSLDDCHKNGYDNTIDILASADFDWDNTFVFSDLDFMGGEFYRNVLRISKSITTSASKATFGFDDSSCIGKLWFVSVQAAPAFSTSFPGIFHRNSSSRPADGPNIENSTKKKSKKSNQKGPRLVRCLIPCAIDQDPYFRLTRDVARKLGYPKPALIHSKFFPSLLGAHSKMSSSAASSASSSSTDKSAAPTLSSTIFMTDTPSQIKKKVNKFAFSGGQETLELHRELGGNPEIDVAYQYLEFFEPNDQILIDLADGYRKGVLTSGEMKAKCIQILTDFVSKFQQRKQKITKDIVGRIMNTEDVIQPRINESQLNGGQEGVEENSLKPEGHRNRFWWMDSFNQ